MKKFFCLFGAFVLFSVVSYAGRTYDVKINGIYYKLGKNVATVVNGSETQIVNNGFEEWEEPAFSPSYKGDVLIPEEINYEGSLYKVTSIEGYKGTKNRVYSYGAFQDCKDLTSITIPKTINSIGQNAFQNCTSLESVYIYDLSAWCNIDFFNNEIIPLNFDANPLIYAHELYLNGTKIENLQIPNDIFEIKTLTFAGGDFLSISLHDGVSKIGVSFSCCTNLKDVYVFSPNLQEGANPFYHPVLTTEEVLANTTLHVLELYKENYEQFPWNAFGRIEYIANEITKIDAISVLSDNRKSYNLIGHQVCSSFKGVVIKNCKKYLVKHK